jgi:hypothetical protein
MANAAEATMTTSATAESAETTAETTANTSVDADSQEENNAADSETNSQAEEATTSKPIRFTGTPRNMVSGIAMLVASIMAFTMGMTDVFFAEATAWTLGIWGALLVYAGMLDNFRVFEITDDALVIKDDYRPWGRLKIWDWERLNRVDVVVKKRGAQPKDIEMQIYYNPEGELAMEREDRIYDAELARLIIERAGLNPAERTNPDLEDIPTEEKQMFSWNK